VPPILVSRREVLALTSMTIANAPALAEIAEQITIPVFRRGVSFHHVLNWPALQSESESPTYVWPPFADDKYKIRAEDLALAQSLGFDFIRLTVDPGLWIAESARHGIQLERHYLDCVETLLASGLNVIFDLAPVENHPDYSPASLISSETPHKFVAYVEMIGRAARLLARAPCNRVALELFNEPPMSGDAGEARWAAMQAALHARARDSAPDLTLILTAAHWGDGAALTRLDVSPYVGSKVIYTFHYYDPHLFTHQGTKSGALSYVSGLNWPLTNAQAREAEADAERAISDDRSLDNRGRAELRDQLRRTFAGASGRPHGVSTIAQDFDAIRIWATANGIAPQRVLLGEFGCVLSSHGRPTGEARLRWLSTIRRLAEAQGFGWAYWALKGYGGMELVDKDGALHADLIKPLGLSASH